MPATASTEPTPASQPLAVPGQSVNRATAFNPAMSLILAGSYTNASQDPETWGIAGFIDWCCHRATKVESTSGLKESLVHSLMGIQLGIPIVLCLMFEVNVLVLLVCIAMWITHEFAAHWE